MGYKVIVNDRAYYSKNVAKKVLNVGEAGLLRTIANGSIGVYNILDDTLIDLQGMEIDDSFCKVQNIGKIIFENLIPVKANSTSLNNYTIIYTPLCEMFSIPSLKESGVHTINFIKFRDLVFDGKYRYKSVLPVMDVCGTKYIALNHSLDDLHTIVLFK